MTNLFVTRKGSTDTYASQRAVGDDDERGDDDLAGHQAPHDDGFAGEELAGTSQKQVESPVRGLL